MMLMELMFEQKGKKPALPDWTELPVCSRVCKVGVGDVLPREELGVGG